MAGPAPSSPWMVNAIATKVDFAKSMVIVELGAGTGVITRELIKRKATDARFIIVERDQDFCDFLIRSFPDQDIACGDVNHLDDILSARGIESVDCIVSSLPLISFDDSLKFKVMHMIVKHLNPEGTFFQVTALPWWRTFYRKYFDIVRYHIVLRDIPPGGIFVCSSPKK